MSRRGGGAALVADAAVRDGACVAGYRLVRLIGTGAHCQVHLARPARPTDPGAGATGNVAVKTVPPTERSRGEAEIVALQAVSSEHVVALRDVATLADGGLCIVQSLGARGTAAALLARRGDLTPGETVTLVASVLRGLGDLHEAGIAHCAVDLTHVVIDATGRPLLSGLGSARVVTGGAGADALRGVDPVEQDLARVARIVQALRDPADARGRASDARWDAWLALLDSVIHGESDLTAHDLADLLLDVADAAPLADAAARPGDEDVEGALPHVPATGDRRSPAVDEKPARTRTRRRALRVHTGSEHGARRRHRAARRRRSEAMTALRVAARKELAAVRPRVWALGASALLLLIAGVLAVPLLTDPAHGAPAGPTTPPAPSPSSAPSSTSTSADGAPAASTDADAEAATSPDPDVAAPALLRLRASCLRGGDMACVGDVDEAGSAVEDADRSAMSAGGIEASEDVALHTTDVLGRAQRLGDSALIELQPAAGDTTIHHDGSTDAASERRPASLLMVRGEAGWRIRDLMDDR
ncbi:protein kinase domain-containing protein [Clavibacter michiganensis]|uniref:Protein kinase domain protein n=1 Tax=Clavibacter michiganensis TaxID=28447 RepID=A0A251YTQ7_9MICO|nr:protein kinase [Clavibacter michiganensis]OUE27634.1 Protein kinase domain protein [Clavibacter michiganensis]